MEDPMISVRALAEWVGANAEADSAFLAPVPGWSVDAHALLDFVAKQTGTPKETLGEWANPTERTI